MNNLTFDYVIDYRDKFASCRKWCKQINLNKKKKVIQKDKISRFKDRKVEFCL